MAVTARPADDQEHKRRSTTDARLQRNDAFMWAILDAAPDGIIVVEPTGRLVLANRRAEELFGHDRRGLLGISVEELIPHHHRAAHLDHRARYHATPQVRPMGDGQPLRARRRDGTEFPVHISLSPLRAESGRLVIAAIRPTCPENTHADDAAATDRPPSESGPIEDFVDRVSATGIYLQQIAGRVDDDTSRRLRCAIEELTIAVAAARGAVAS